MFHDLRSNLNTGPPDRRTGLPPYFGVSFDPFFRTFGVLPCTHVPRVRFKTADDIPRFETQVDVPFLGIFKFNHSMVSKMKASGAISLWLSQNKSKKNISYRRFKIPSIALARGT